MTPDEFQALFNAVRAAQEGHDLAFANRQREIDEVPMGPEFGNRVAEIMRRLQQQSGHLADQFRRLLPACDTMIEQYRNDEALSDEDQRAVVGGYEEQRRNIARLVTLYDFRAGRPVPLGFNPFSP